MNWSAWSRRSSPRLARWARRDPRPSSHRQVCLLWLRAGRGLARRHRMGMTIRLLGMLLVAASGLPAALAAPLPGQARLTIVFVLDGLRPDSITPDETPTLWRLAREGVTYLNGHAVFPTVTR